MFPGKTVHLESRGEDEEFSSGSPTLFSLDGSIHYELLGFLNSCVANQMLSFINPTINTGNGYVLSMPYISDYPQKDRVCSLVQENIGLCKQDWDSFEVSADFKKHPLLVGLGNDGLVLADKFNEIKETWLQRFTLLKKNEEELNEIFINTYGLSLFGEANFENNLSFIAEALSGKGSPREIISSYFLSNFYPDHLKVFQKRPIYWLFDAGKKNSFKAFVYIHRYSSDTLATLRTDYILPLLDRYNSRIDFLTKELVTLSGNEASKTTKELERLKGQFQELSEYEPKVHHLADQHIELNLDDGVKSNYEKLADVLAPLK
jgi:hypothetical protein